MLAHATDADGDTLTVTAVSDTTSGAGTVGNSLAGAYGHLTLNANGSYSYVADNSAAIAAAPTGSHLQDTFNYAVSDGHGGTATASLTITLDRAPVANNSTATDVAGSTVSATAASGVLVHASDPDGGTLTVTAVSDAASGAGTLGNSLAGAYGHLTLNADGSYSYVADNSAAIAAAPTGSHLQDSFSYAVSNGLGGTASATLTVTVDRAPTVTLTNVTALTASQSSVPVSALISASDPDGDAITTYGVMNTGNGQLVLNGVVQASNQEIDVTAAQLSQLSYQSAAGGGSLQVRVSDGTQWSSWALSYTAANTKFTTGGTANSGNTIAFDPSGASDPIRSFLISGGGNHNFSFAPHFHQATTTDVVPGTDPFHLAHADVPNSSALFAAIHDSVFGHVAAPELVHDVVLHPHLSIGHDGFLIR